MKQFGLATILFIIFVLGAATTTISSAQNLTTLVSFDGSNGSAPSASLIQASDGNLYGTTEYGGPINGCEGGFNPCGTVFKITLSGTLTTLHTFVYSDGAFPVSPVVQGADGNFYGTNQGEGDSGGAGAIFKMTAGGTVTVLSSTSSPAGLVQGRDGNFYGTTPRSYTDGTVFKITPSGTLTTLHTFEGTDGNNPQAGLIQATDGNFYGTTYSGGTSNYCGGGCGTVFKMTPSGSLTTLHSFSGTDGYNVAAGLVEGTDGNFYGTTFNGGPQNVGEVYKITPSGTLTVLYSFCSQTSCTDGAYPRAALVQATDGSFYGTTSAGGAYGQGTVFAMTPSGSLTTLYTFCPQSGCADGANPIGGVIQASDGNFYGTTNAGGNNNSGTVFKLQPQATLTVSVAGQGAVTSTDSFINCPGTCTHTYDPGTPGHTERRRCFGLGLQRLDWRMQRRWPVQPHDEREPCGHGSLRRARPRDSVHYVTPCRLVDTRTAVRSRAARQSFICRSWGLQHSQPRRCRLLAECDGGAARAARLSHHLAHRRSPACGLHHELARRPHQSQRGDRSGGNQWRGERLCHRHHQCHPRHRWLLPAPGVGTYQFYPLTPCRVVDTRG